MDICARIRSGSVRLATAALLAVVLVPWPAHPANAQEKADPDWVVPRTPAGHPDLQGNWSNATITPIQRWSEEMGPVFTWEQVRAIESGAMSAREAANADSDPDADRLRWAESSPAIVLDRSGAPAVQRVLHRFRRPHCDLQLGAADIARRQPRTGGLRRLNRGGPRGKWRRKPGVRWCLRHPGDRPRPSVHQCRRVNGGRRSAELFYNNNYTIVQNTDTS